MNGGKKARKTARDLIETLITQSVNELSENGRLSSCLLPPSVRDVLNSLACHGKP